MTLIELMIVLVILGILAAAAGPSVRRSIERAAAKGNAREIANTLRMARNQAMSRGEVLVVRIAKATAESRGTIQILRSGDISGATATTDPTTTDPTDPTLTEPPPPIEPARNCRQTSLTTWEAANVVHTTTLDGKTGMSEIAMVDPLSDSTGGTLELCFSPDGRVLTPATAAVPMPASAGGCGENVIIVVADDGATIGTLASCTGSGTDSNGNEIPAMERLALRDARDAINLYRVTVSYNGSIQVVQ